MEKIRKKADQIYQTGIKGVVMVSEDCQAFTDPRNASAHARQTTNGVIYVFADGEYIREVSPQDRKNAPSTWMLAPDVVVQKSLAESETVDELKEDVDGLREDVVGLVESRQKVEELITNIASRMTSLEGDVKQSKKDFSARFDSIGKDLQLINAALKGEGSEKKINSSD